MDAIDKLLTRRVEKIYPSKAALEKVLRSGKKLKIYLGIDPSGPNIHIGNAVVLWKLREFQDLGHKIILLVGDFTGRIGDPSDKTAMRKQMTLKEVLENAKTYKKQAAKILDFSSTKNPAGFRFNSQWLDKLTFKEVIELAAHFSVQQMIERDLFQRRLKENKSIGLHEFLYPLMQGYDSVAMNVDVEVGGSDQTFNMLAGRILVKAYLGKEKFVLTTPLLEGTDGKKMSKSWGNVINVMDSATDMFGKAMSVKDELIDRYFDLATNVPDQEVKRLKRGLRTGQSDPMSLKKKLAFEIVRIYQSEKSAREAQRHFEMVVQKRQLPEEIPTKEIKTLRDKEIKVTDLIMRLGLASSKSQAKRLVEQGAVEINKFKVPAFAKATVGRQSSKFTVKIKDGMIVRVGKRKWVRIKIR